MEGLAGADMVVAVEPLVRAAEKHPELAAGVLEALANGQTMHAKAVPHLRKFCKHEKPQVRAAAVTALCTAALDDVENELLGAFGDPQSEVRIAAASAMLHLLDRSRTEVIQNRGQRVRQEVEGVVVQAPTGLGTRLLSAVTQLLGGRPSAGHARTSQRSTARQRG